MNDEQLIDQVSRKIEREKVMINAAMAMRQSSNPQVQQSLDSQIREARKGLTYLEGKMRELQMRRMGGQGPDGPSSPRTGPVPPAHGGLAPQAAGLRNQREGPPTPPPKDGRSAYITDAGDYGNPGGGGYMDDLSGGHGMMPPRAPFGPPAPGAQVPKARPNYTKLGVPIFSI